jgi:aflatoxin B1 aldehyde reductase
MSSPSKTPHLSQPIATVFGGTRIGNRPLFTPANGLERFLEILAVHGVATIDTAQSYRESETTIGQVKAGDRFVIDTKWSPLSFTEPTLAWATKDKITGSAQDSIQKLQVSQV